MENKVNDSIVKRSQHLIDAIIAAWLQSTSDDRLITLLGPKVSRLRGSGTGKTLIRACLWSDLARYSIQGFKGSTSETTSENCYLVMCELIGELGRSYDKYYDRFPKKLLREDLNNCIEFYVRDTGRFGFDDRLTNGMGISICEKAEMVFGVTNAVSRYEAIVRELNANVQIDRQSAIVLSEEAKFDGGTDGGKEQVAGKERKKEKKSVWVIGAITCSALVASLYFVLPLIENKKQPPLENKQAVQKLESQSVDLVVQEKLSKQNEKSEGSSPSVAKTGEGDRSQANPLGNLTEAPQAEDRRQAGASGVDTERSDEPPARKVLRESPPEVAKGAGDNRAESIVLSEHIKLFCERDDAFEGNPSRWHFGLALSDSGETVTHEQVCRLQFQVDGKPLAPFFLERAFTGASSVYYFQLVPADQQQYQYFIQQLREIGRSQYVYYFIQIGDFVREGDLSERARQKLSELGE